MGLRVVLVDVDEGRRAALQPALAERGYATLWSRSVTIEPILSRFAADVAVVEGTPARTTIRRTAPDVPVLDASEPEGLIPWIEQLFPPPDILQCAGVTVSLSRREVRHRDGVAHHRLTAMECRLLRFLAEQRGRFTAEDEILTKVWRYAKGARTNAVRNAVYRLRRKLEADPAHPVTLQRMPGSGYRLCCP